MARRPQTRALSAELRMEYQRCHAIGHRWESIPVTKPPVYGAAMDLRCENCATVRRDIFSRVSGERIGHPYYVYPDGYHDYERHDKAWWRAAFAESVLQAARAYINTDNENAKALLPTEQRRVQRAAMKEWRESLLELVQGGPPNPSPRPTESARSVRRNRQPRKAMRQT